MNWKYFLYPLLLPLIVMAAATMLIGVPLRLLDTAIGKSFFWILD